MPELPEVETVRATLAAVLPGCTVESVTTDGSARYASAEDALGATITSVRRAGKYLLIGLGAAAEDGSTTEDAELVVHLGMSGQLLLVDPTVPSPRFRVRATLRLPDTAGARRSDDLGLELRDVRGFGRATIVPVGDHRDLGVLARLGPEPDDEDLEAWLVARFAGRQLAVKALLLDQSVIGGVGNIYADEALHRAGIHPEARGGDLRRPAIATLRTAVRAVIAEGVANGGTTLRDYRQADGSGGEHQHHLAVYGRDGEPCTTCGSAIVKIRSRAEARTSAPPASADRGAGPGRRRRRRPVTRPA